MLPASFNPSAFRFEGASPAMLVLTRVMSARLFGVRPTDPVTYAVGSAALGAIALLATYVPARRASRVDPVVALRADV